MCEESATSSEPSIFYYHPDHLGSTAIVTDVDGRITQNVVYIPFGEVFVEQRDGNWNTPYLFNAKELDEETGLYYYGVRYFDPTAAQWLSVDPLFVPYHTTIVVYNVCLDSPIESINMTNQGDFTFVVFSVILQSIKEGGTMKVQYHNEYSNHLNRNIEWKQYGENGQGVLVIPSQDQRFYEWEDQGMIDVLSPFIEQGQIHIICCDSIDAETWSLTDGNYRERIELHESWFHYITDELIPCVNNGKQLVVAGCSMGGYHAANFFFRRPDLFCSLLSLSGLFHADYFFPDFKEELILRNSPLHFLAELHDPNVLLDACRGKQIILCCGQGDYEDITCPSTLRLGELLQKKNISAWVDIWGQDVHHDFNWWRKQAQYFFSHLFIQQQVKAA